MTFQIHAVNPDEFASLFDLSEAELRGLGARLQTVTAKPGFPCRVSLADAEVGETVLLVNHEHLDKTSPYRASHAIYIRKGAEQRRLEPGQIPEVLSSRLLSVRGFDCDHLMCEADVVDGRDLGPTLERFFLNAKVTYIHVHNAKPGCFAAHVSRVGPASPDVGP